MRLCLSRALIVIVLWIPFQVQAATPVTVGAYNFNPLITFDADGDPEGLVVEVVAELNRRQQQFAFEILRTSSKRRFEDYRLGRYDVILFESLNWGWGTMEVDATSVLLEDEEVFVALDKPERDQSFFDQVTERRLLAILGYHYGFADFDADEDRLTQRFDIEMSRSQERNMALILADRPSVAEVAVMPRSFLKRFRQKRPEDAAKLLVSEQPDQVYHLRGIVRPAATLGAGALEALFREMIDDGTYPGIVRRYGMRLPELLANESP
ncbi:transporter substrate-binding domain-containing protein [Marinobacter nanhaiticus D15-8W]|uniref:Amino acid ABC transporter substrate-binding protein n=1 Tax=Marinobacter nanhaiticus D15-8W TaxID=626887 RepID=N6WU97_9GAMM|nr:transporter substrate-binding domain-containing protein [Marinobacter nanhaiticus]ENO15111.1 amino acid ABC transporter substrate-binding protein [Marinobacter nanhaiticus D15-8W]BES69190.1 transporter substrate-binding domain-containing protein [Marinobacter nanhaiticus D15-8W]